MVAICEILSGFAFITYILFVCILCSHKVSLSVKEVTSSGEELAAQGPGEGRVLSPVPKAAFVLIWTECIH